MGSSKRQAQAPRAAGGHARQQAWAELIVLARACTLRTGTLTTAKVQADLAQYFSARLTSGKLAASVRGAIDALLCDGVLVPAGMKQVRLCDDARAALADVFQAAGLSDLTPGDGTATYAALRDRLLVATALEELRDGGAATVVTRLVRRQVGAGRTSLERAPQRDLAVLHRIADAVAHTRGPLELRAAILETAFDLPSGHLKGCALQARALLAGHALHAAFGTPFVRQAIASSGAVTSPQLLKVGTGLPERTAKALCATLPAARGAQDIGTVVARLAAACLGLHKSDLAALRIGLIQGAAFSSDLQPPSTGSPPATMSGTAAGQGRRKQPARRAPLAAPDTAADPGLSNPPMPADGPKLRLATQNGALVEESVQPAGAHHQAASETALPHAAAPDDNSVGDVGRHGDGDRDRNRSEEPGRDQVCDEQPTQEPSSVRPANAAAPTAGSEATGNHSAQTATDRQGSEAGRRAREHAALIDFARQVQEVAQSEATGWAGDRRALIEVVWRALNARQRAGQTIDLAAFKAWLLAAHQRGLLTLVNADLRARGALENIRASQVSHQGMHWHYIRAPAADSTATTHSRAHPGADQSSPG